MREARETIKKAIETIEEMNAKYCEKYGIENIEDEIIKPFWCYSFGFDKVKIYKQTLAESFTYRMTDGIVKDAIRDIESRKSWEIALAEGRA